MNRLKTVRRNGKKYIVVGNQLVIDNRGFYCTYEPYIIGFAILCFIILMVVS